MLLTNFMQLAANLTDDTSFYIKTEPLQALGKIQLLADKAVLLPGKTPLNKGKLFKILSQAHNRALPLRIKLNSQEIIPFGLQLRPKKRQAILM